MVPAGGSNRRGRGWRGRGGRQGQKPRPAPGQTRGHGSLPAAAAKRGARAVRQHAIERSDGADR
eukprot:8087026-Lingulodinium_polyedra.AAC.1